MAMKFHFLNVGHGECTLIELPDGNLMIVDINTNNDLDEESAHEVASELNFSLREGSNHLLDMVEAYNIELDDVFAEIADLVDEGGTVCRYVQTHPDLDHMRGISTLVDKYTIGRFWDTNHTNITKESFLSDSDKRDWDAYVTRRAISPTHFKRYSKIEDGGYVLHVFHPTQAALDAGDSRTCPDTNAFSQVILVEYGDTRVLLTGDMEQKWWKEFYEWLQENPTEKSLLTGIDVLQAPHHGRNSGRCGWENGGSFCRDFLNLLDPDLVVVSVGKKPSTDKQHWYRLRPDGTSREVWSTRWRGTVWVEAEDTGAPSFDSRLRNDDAKAGRQSVAAAGLVILPNSRQVQILAKIGRSESGPFPDAYNYWVNKRAIPKKRWLEFTVKTDLQRPYRLTWRVTNTGPEAAAEVGGLRGELLPDEDDSGRRVEHTQYRGVHFVEVFIEKDGYVHACKLPVRIK